MKGYLIISWNPWDCEITYKKVFLSKEEADEYVKKYIFNMSVQEELEIIEVEVG